MKVLPLILALLLAAGCGAGVPPSQVLPGPPPPQACVDTFSGNVSRTCR
jgi:hypothetical protein